MEKTQKILIVDDNNDNLKVAANILKSPENIVWIATSGKTGIEIAKTKNPDIILLDIQMPEMDGFEVCKIIKGDLNTKYIPIIFMTARTDDESIKKAFDAGAADYITKPIKNFEVLARVNTQLKLVESIKNLKKTISVKDQFFSIIAHDLRGPIGSMAALFKMVNEKFETFDIEEIKSIIQGTSESTTKVYNLLNNLLEWAKNQTGIIKFNPQNLNVRHLIQENIDTTHIVFSKKNITVKNNCDREFEVFADKEMMNVIIRNLLSNAIKFTNNGGEIEFGNNKNEEYNELYIKDNGVGMNEETKNKLFKIEKKILSVGTEGEKGSGIGLSLCYDFIIKHGWNIVVESEEGKGSKFTIKIPLN